MVCLLLAKRIPPQIISIIVGNPLSFPIVIHDSSMFAAVACRLFTVQVAVVKFASIEPLVLQIVLVIPQAHPASFAVVNGIDRSINKELCFWLHKMPQGRHTSALTRPQCLLIFQYGG